MPSNIVNTSASPRSSAHGMSKADSSRIQSSQVKAGLRLFRTLRLLRRRDGDYEGERGELRRYSCATWKRRALMPLASITMWRTKSYMTDVDVFFRVEWLARGLQTERNLVNIGICFQESMVVNIPKASFTNYDAHKIGNVSVTGAQKIRCAVTKTWSKLGGSRRWRCDLHGGRQR